jgi:uncharacterized protein with von Willebrand factor type A (vWA) domain
MAERPRPVTREKILKLAVTGQDAFSALRYLRHRESVPRLPELEEQGQTVIPGSEGVLADLYHSLWDPEPSLKEESETPTDRRYWRSMLGEAMTSSAFAELHSATQLSELKSVLGTIGMGETILALVPEEDRKKLEELAQAQAEADHAQAQVDEAQAEADALAKMAEQAGQAESGQPSDQQSDGEPQSGQGQSAPSQSGSPSGQPSSGMGQLTPEQAQELANQLAEATAQAKAKTDVAKAKAEEAQLEADIKAEELMGQPGSAEAANKLRELARIGQSALQKAQTEVKEVSETIETWGLEEAGLTQQGIPEALDIMSRMRRNESFKKFAAILGRIRKIAARKARARIAGEGARISATETGRDLKRAHSSELVALVHPALRIKALERWTRGELRLHGERKREKLGHGPVIVLEDASGSMDGVKQQWAKATTLALAYYAKLQKRSFGWAMFDYSVKLSRIYPKGQMSATELLEIAEARAGGGTNFEAPLLKALEMIRTEGLSKADIVLITDGECAVSDAFLKEFLATKQALEINVITVLCNVGSSSDSTVRKFSDNVEHVSAFTADEAETQVFSRL